MRHRARRSVRGVAAAASATLVTLAAAAGMPGAAPPASTEPAAAAPTTLRQAVDGRFLIGTAVTSRQIDDPALSDLINRQFDCVTGENEFKPDALEPRPGEFKFGAADKIVEFARQYEMSVVGNTLCWHRQTPAWMFQDKDGRPLPREQALANLKGYIDEVAGHFAGRVIGWNVVSEAISDEPGVYLRDTPARKAIGDDYIIKAFQFARAADADAELYYDDYGDERDEKLEKTIRLINELKAAGVSVDAVGIKCHFSIRFPGGAFPLNSAINAYAAEGIKVMITELDIDMLPSAYVNPGGNESGGPDPWPNGLPANVAQAQADFYRQIFAIVLKHPDDVTRVTIWGTHDGTSWLNNWPAKGRHNHPLLWDRAMRPKPAFDAVLRVLMAPVPASSG